MPLLLNDVVQVSIRGTAVGQRIILTSAWEVTATESNLTTKQDLTAIITAISNAGAGNYRETYLKLLGTEYTLTSYRAQQIHSTRTPYVQVLDGATIGLGGGVAGTANLSCGLTRICNAVGRSKISTFKIGPIPSIAITNGLLTVGFSQTVSDMGARWIQNLVTAAPVITLRPVIWHRRATPPNAEPITDYRVGTAVRDMTRRVVGRGE